MKLLVSLSSLWLWKRLQLRPEKLISLNVQRVIQVMVQSSVYSFEPHVLYMNESELNSPRKQTRLHSFIMLTNSLLLSPPLSLEDLNVFKYRVLPSANLTWISWLVLFFHEPLPPSSLLLWGLCLVLCLTSSLYLLSRGVSQPSPSSRSLTLSCLSSFYSGLCLLYSDNKPLRYRCFFRFGATPFSVFHLFPCTVHICLGFLSCYILPDVWWLLSLLPAVDLCHSGFNKRFPLAHSSWGTVCSTWCQA